MFVAIAFDNFCQQSILAALLLFLFVELLLDTGEFYFGCFYSLLLDNKVPGNEDCRWNQVGLEPPFTLVVVV